MNFFEFIAAEVREYLAQLGFRSLDEAIGHAELLDPRAAVEHWKAAGLDLTPVLYVPDLPAGTARHCVTGQDHGLDKALDNTLILLAEGALQSGTPVRLELPVRNVNRAVGTMLGSELTRRWGGDGLPDDTIDVTLAGSAGQSLGAFLPRGITLRLRGDANDYLGKGLSGGRIIAAPDPAAPFPAEQHVIAGNVIGYGATSGEMLLRGVVGERFCVRNSGRRRGGRGDRRPRLRVHDRRPGRDPRAGRAELRGRHVRRHRLPARPRSAPGQHRDGRPGAADRAKTASSCAGCSAASGRDRLVRRGPAARGLAGRAGPVRPGDAGRLQAGAGRATAGRAGRNRRERGRDGRGFGLRARGEMADPRGFMTTPRRLPQRRPVDIRIMDWKEVYPEFGAHDLERQAGRCMDCGIPFCHQGCPLGNLIPEWNDLIHAGDWRAAVERLHATNNFPEFTGRLCPAPCESACVLGISAEPVTIKQVEVSIIDRAWDEGWVPPRRPSPAAVAAGQKVAVVGSGPAGLAAAQQLTRAGHTVTVFERADAPGGLLRYGIPEFKMEKRHLDRRLVQMLAEGTEFRCGVRAGTDISAARLRRDYAAIVLACGATVPRGLPVPGADLDGIHQAMDYLPLANKAAAQARRRSRRRRPGHLRPRPGRGHHRRR